MGINIENSGTTTPILNLGINFRESNKNTAYRGSAFRMDARGAGNPLFQFFSRSVSSATDNLVVSIDSNGSMQLGLVYGFPTAAAIPASLNMGNTYSTTAGQNMKIGVLGLAYGFGVSNLQLDYMVPATGNHVFYVDGVEKMKLSTAGNLTVAGSTNTSGNLTVTGSANIGSSTIIGGNTSISGNLTVGTIVSGTDADSLLTVSSGGIIHKRSLATVGSIYTSDGTLISNRTVSQGSNTLTFSGTGNILLQSGKVGIGTNTPAEALDVKGSIQLSSATIPMSIYAENSGTTAPILNLGINFRETNKNTAYRGGAIRVDTRTIWPLFQFLSRSVGSSTDNLVVAIDSSGDLQLGLVYASPISTTTPVHIDMGNTYSPTGGQNMKIGVLGSTYGFGVSNLQLDYMVPATGNHVFYVAGVEKMRLSAAGNLTVAGTITPSDKRLKSNIKPLDYGLQTILQLAPKQYEQVKTIQIKNGRPVADPSNPKPYHTIGFIAQELNKVVPEAVHQPTDEANEIWGVDYTKMVPIIIKAIQEQQTEIELLKQQNRLLQEALAAQLKDRQRDIPKATREAK